ncbi:TPA: glycoside hydrolase family 32 protein [Enterococcus faecium]|nr:glycoside hydrolase family 32 protein [Enterococcus faecium]
MIDIDYLKKANQHILNNKEIVNPQFKPSFHFAPLIGWINDPNGFSKFNDEYHLFYQYNPYDAIWGTIYWGHAKSKDGISWEHMPPALAPDQSYDNDGCYSGSALEKDGKLYVMYTGHVVDEEGNYQENQNIAYSEDGIHFYKYSGNPVLTSKDIPAGSSKIDFRDPKLFQRDGIYYCLIGSQTETGEGQVLLYRSYNLLSWEYVSVFLTATSGTGKMAECPDLLSFPDKDYLLVSAVDVKQTHETISHISYVFEGKVDWDSFTFIPTKFRPIDHGLDFYAPQTLKEDDHYLMIAWMQHWRRTFPTQERNHHWLGQMTLPRVITEENGILKQRVIDSIQDYCKEINEEKNKKVWGYELLSSSFVNYLHLEITSSNLTDFSLSWENEFEQISLGYEKEKQELFFNRGKLKQKIYEAENEISSACVSYPNTKQKLVLDCYIDTSSIEVIVNGCESITSTFYFSESPTKLVWQSTELVILDKYVAAKIK